jgi:poly-gamma-glutamate capsule biosynthesis protein CapA/YwtB (metallophosphatase superfamily)
LKKARWSISGLERIIKTEGGKVAPKSLTLLAVGELVLGEPKAEHFLSLAAPVLKSGDVVVGQGEIAFTARGASTYVEMYHPYPGCPPANMKALADAGFNVITLAGNHVWDSGAAGIEDTLTGFRNLNIATVGAGMNIDEARKPAIIERNGTRVGFLSYNCIGPMGSWATPAKPGCAWVRIITAYEMNMPNPGGVPEIYTFAEPHSLGAMTEDVQKLRPLCDVLVVAFHKGIMGAPEKLAMYDQQVSYTAVDAGADLILGHHANGIKGIEMYKGKAIFHGLGRFVPAMAPETEAQIRTRDYLAAPGGSSDPNKNRTIIAKVVISGGKIMRVSYLPCLVNAHRQPEVLKNDKRGKEASDFMDKISKSSGLNTRYQWQDNEVQVFGDKI